MYMLPIRPVCYMDKLPDVDIPDDSPSQAAYTQHHLKALLRRLYFVLPALLLQHDRNLVKHSLSKNSECTMEFLV